VLEVLRDGQAYWSEVDEHFRFGCLKAKLMVSSLNVIRAFLEAEDPGGLFEEPTE